jgi:hypothetical protein
MFFVGTKTFELSFVTGNKEAIWFYLTKNHWRIYQHGVSATATPLRTEVIAEIFCIFLINICTKD